MNEFPPRAKLDAADPLLGAKVDSSAAAELLGVEVGTLRQWRKRAVGPRYFRLEGSVRYLVDDLRKYLREHLLDPNA